MVSSRSKVASRVTSPCTKISHAMGAMKVSSSMNPLVTRLGRAPTVHLCQEPWTAETTPLRILQVVHNDLDRSLVQSSGYKESGTPSPHPGPFNAHEARGPGCNRFRQGHGWPPSAAGDVMSGRLSGNVRVSAPVRVVDDARIGHEVRASPGTVSRSSPNQRLDSAASPMRVMAFARSG